MTIYFSNVNRLWVDIYKYLFNKLLSLFSHIAHSISHASFVVINRKLNQKTSWVFWNINIHNFLCLLISHEQNFRFVCLNIIFKSARKSEELKHESNCVFWYMLKFEKFSCKALVCDCFLKLRNKNIMYITSNIHWHKCLKIFIIRFII